MAKWSRGQKPRLRQLFRMGVPVPDMCAELNHAQDEVYAALRELGLDLRQQPKPSRYGQRWSVGKVEMLKREWVKGTPMKTICLLTGKDTKAVRAKRTALGLQPRSRKGRVRVAVKIWLLPSQIAKVRMMAAEVGIPYSTYVNKIVERGIPA